ncbi:hypothetical protein Chor_012198 [Crotalus horridus]
MQHSASSHDAKSVAYVLVGTPQYNSGIYVATSLHMDHHFAMICLLHMPISRCPFIPCYVSAQDECLWTDWVTEKNINGRQAKHYACIKRSDGSCAWYRGVAPPKQEFLDIEDP